MSIVRSFRKCSITIALDSSEDSDINIRGLEGYTVGAQSPESEGTSSGSDDEYEPGSNYGDDDAVGEGDAVGEEDAVGGDVQE